MFQVLGSTISNFDLSKVVLAVGALGTAAYGLVDISKAFGGGISRTGFGDVEDVIRNVVPGASGNIPPNSALGLPSILATLRANWLNGMALTDQKAVAKALIKLDLTPENAPAMAKATGVDVALLTKVATKIQGGPAETERLTPAESDVFGRFDLLLSALLDQAYQRGDQRYRNGAKLAAVPIAVGLALLGTWSIDGGCWLHGDFWKAVACGLLATPLAPVAKDLASAIQAGAKVAQAWKI